MLEKLTEKIAKSDDLIQNNLRNPVDSNELELAYYLPLCDLDKINQFITVPYSRQSYSFMQLLKSNPNFTKLDTLDEGIDLLLKGSALVGYKGELYAFEAILWKNVDSPEITTESAVRGPQHSISEHPLYALNMIRNSYAAPSLKTSLCYVGSISQTNAYIIFDEERADQQIVDKIYKKIEDLTQDVISTPNELELHLMKSKYNLFPNFLLTERVDRIAKALQQGKVVILMKGSQFALICNVNFFDFMHSAEDHYESFWISKLLITIRYVALFFTITLPGLYIAILAYNPEFVRLQLAFNLVASRSVVPYPAFIEVFIMLFLIEILVEASIRIPKLIGPASTTVGGLILGSAIQQAGLVSSIMVIVTSLVAISNFVIPIYSMGLAIRFLKYPIIVLAIFFGLTGVFVGLFFYIAYLCHMRSYGVPYFHVGFKEKYEKQKEQLS